MVVNANGAKSRGVFRRRAGAGANVATQVALALWLVVVVNVWAFQHSWRFDLTADRRYALTPEAKTLLRQLPRNVDVVIPFTFAPSALGRVQQGVLERAMRVLREFELVNPSLRVKDVVHVGSDPQGWQRLQSEHKLEHPNRVYFFSGDRREVVTIEDLANIKRPNPQVGDPELVSERVLEALTAAVRAVTDPARPQVLFTQGSGELALESKNPFWSMNALRSALTDRGYDVGPINLREEPEIPEDTELLVVVSGGPAGFDALVGERRHAVLRHLRRGGALLLFLPYVGPSGLEAVLRDCGINVGLDDAIVYERGVARAGPRAVDQLHVKRFADDHPITRGFTFGQFLAELPRFRELRVEKPGHGILFSAEDSWLERTPSRPLRDADERTGPFPLAAVYDPPPDAPSGRRGRIAVYASWSAAIDTFFRGDARRVLLNTIYWLTNREDFAAAPGREPVVTRLLLTPSSKRAFFWTSIVVLPGCSILGGFFVFWRRRRS